MATAGRRCGGRGVESGLTSSTLCDRPGCKAAVGRLHCTLAPSQVGGPPLPSSPSSHKGLPYHGSHCQHSQCPPIRDELCTLACSPGSGAYTPILPAPILWESMSTLSMSSLKGYNCQYSLCSHQAMGLHHLQPLHPQST